MPSTPHQSYAEKCAAIIERRMRGEQAYLKLSCGCRCIWAAGGVPVLNIRSRLKDKKSYCKQHNVLIPKAIREVLAGKDRASYSIQITPTEFWEFVKESDGQPE